ncbi:MAG: sodium:solute symporter, partial [Gemmatimonadota bacterium]|nr:sodium:solute symporter [Gemmatimonadota bacterium]
SIAVIGAVTLVYTYFGGIKAVVWVDAVQMGLYLLGAVVAIAALQVLTPDGWTGILSSAGEVGKLDVLDWSLDFSLPYTVWAGVLGGAVFTMASHGTDQLLVQRLLTCRDVEASKKALIGSGIVVMGQFLLFLVVGLGLWVYYEGRAFDTTDEIFARFIVEELPPGISGLIVAGVFAAAMSSLSSSINSLASASAYDFWAPWAGAEDDEARTLRAGKVFTLVWATLLVGGAILFIQLSEGNTAVEVALAIASVVYGGLLGTFILAIRSQRADQRSAIVGMIAGISVVAAIWWFARASVAWPWFVPIGTAVTMAVGWALGRGSTAGPGSTLPESDRTHTSPSP